MCRCAYLKNKIESLTGSTIKLNFTWLKPKLKYDICFFPDLEDPLEKFHLNIVKSARLKPNRYVQLHFIIVYYYECNIFV